MAFIGKEPLTGAYSMLDAITASATASYSLTLDSVAFVPESANHLLVSLNGSIQKAGSSYTVSGSTLTFSSALTSSDSIDFVLALGNVLDIGTPSDATVTNAKTNFVSTSSSAGLDIKGDGTTAGTLRLMCEQGSHGIKLRSPAHSASQSYTLTFPTTAPSADKIMQTDGSGNLSFVDAPSGAMTLLASGTPSSSQVSNITFDNVFSTTYDFYKFYAYFNSTSQNVDLRFVFRSGGSDITGSYYRGTGEGAKLNSSGSESQALFVARYNQGYLDLLDSANNNANIADLLDLTFYDPTGRDDGNIASIHGKIFSFTSGSEMRSSLYMAHYANQGSGENYDGGKFYYSSGNIYYSSYQLYGVKKS